MLLAEQLAADAGPLAEAKAVLRGIKDWPKNAQAAAAEMVKKYGPPSCTTSMMLVWHNQPPWTKIIVHAKEVAHNWPVLHMDVLEQVMDYRVPLDRYSALVQFDGSVWAARTKGELTAYCHKETMNFLAINMAHKVIQGMSPKDARRQYEATVKAVMAGKSPDITKGLTFDWKHMGVTADPDTTAL